MTLPQQKAASMPPTASYTTLEDWLQQCAGPFFPTRSALDWFIKAHRGELVRRGALITRAGRSGSLIESEKFSRAVVDIFKRKSAERMARSA